MNILKMTDQDLRGKRVLIREDLNVPVSNGCISSDKRLAAALCTIESAQRSKARVILLSHLGRPKEGEFTKEDSLAPVAKRLSEMLHTEVLLVHDYLHGVEVEEGQVVLCENVRFNVGEAKDDEELGRCYAALCDVFVMDAFATAHRAQASTSAVARFAPVACAGPLLVKELDALERSMRTPKHPFVAIIGGSKVSTKLSVLDALSKKVDTLIVGGGIANNVIKAAGYEVGRSLFEPNLVAEAARLMKSGADIPLPVDVVTALALSADSPAFVKNVEDVKPDDMILDIGPKTAQIYASLIKKAATVIWNGPLGAFEIDQFGKGTEAVGKAVTESEAFSIAGGGDTLSAIEKYDLEKGISYLSTGGGAFLEFVEGKILPAVAALEKRFYG